MAAPDIAKLFDRNRSGHRRWRERAEARIVTWEWASGPLVGRSTLPFADYDVNTSWGRKHQKEPAKKTSSTVAYGLDADGEVVICRSHGPGTSYIEEITHHQRNGTARAKYRHDSALVAVSFASYEGGNLVRFQWSDWQQHSLDYVLTYRNGRVARMKLSRVNWGYQKRCVYEMDWNDAGRLESLTVRYLPKGKPEPIFQRATCGPKFLERLADAGL